jgi:hypothetical protein
MFAPVLLLLVGAVELARAAHVRANNLCLNGKNTRQNDILNAKLIQDQKLRVDPAISKIVRHSSYIP